MENARHTVAPTGPRTGSFPLLAGHLGGLHQPFAVLGAHPLVWHPGHQLWLLSGYEDCCRVLGDARFGKEYRAPDGAASAIDQPSSKAVRALVAMRDRWLLRRDPPAHTRLKSVIRQVLSPRAVSRLLPLIRAHVNTLLNRVGDATSMDIVSHLAAPLPIGVMTHLLGIPSIEPDFLLSWSRGLMRLAEPVYSQTDWEAGSEQTEQLMARLEPLIRAARARPGDSGLLAHLIRAQDQGKLDDLEVFATCTLLLFGGSGTTTDLIGNCALALLQRPPHLDRARRDPSSLHATVDESLRCAPPLQMCTRVAHEDVDLHGQRIRAGEWVGILLGPACRDPRYFPDPDVFSIDRTKTTHLPFGHGNHFCPGMALARATAAEAIRALLRRMPALALESPPIPRDTFVFRGLSQLRVTTR